MARRGNYRYTPRRAAALKKAQLASARKRKGMGKKKLAIGVAGGLAAAIAGAAIAHKVSGSKLSVSHRNNTSRVDGRNLGNGIRGVTVGRHSSIVVGHGHRSTSVSYRFGRARATVTGSRTRNAVDHDSIPFYNPKANKNWPHVNIKDARKKNQKLREQGMLA